MKILLLKDGAVSGLVVEPKRFTLDWFAYEYLLDLVEAHGSGHQFSYWDWMDELKLSMGWFEQEYLADEDTES